MLVCESEENRRKLAWLVPGYILLAWFFCVVFQPLGLTDTPGQGNNNDHNDEALYEIINLQDSAEWRAKCESGERERIVLGSGSASGLILRLTAHQYYRYEAFNCSLEVVAGPDVDGVTAVVEHLDLRGEEVDHWTTPICPDYLMVRTEQSIVHQKFCGQWDVERDQQLTLAGNEKNIIGYCVEDRSGHSCETRRIFVDVAIEHNKTLSNKHPNLRKSDRHGFTLVLTAWRHPTENGECKEGELTCPNSDGGVHNKRSHCIWQKMLCDGHQNCGFKANRDEWGCRLGRDTAWSFGTITVLVALWITIVTILMLATVFLLQWNRFNIRTPLEVISENRQHDIRARPLRSGLIGQHRGTNVDRNNISIPLNGQQSHVMSRASATDPQTGGMVSIMVMYRPPGQPPTAKTIDLPPTYDSLFTGENPPGYNMLTLSLTSGEGANFSEEAPPLGVAENGGLLVPTSEDCCNPTSGVETSGLTSGHDHVERSSAEGQVGEAVTESALVSDSSSLATSLDDSLTDTKTSPSNLSERAQCRMEQSSTTENSATAADTPNDLIQEHTTPSTNDASESGQAKQLVEGAQTSKICEIFLNSSFSQPSDTNTFRNSNEHRDLPDDQHKDNVEKPSQEVDYLVNL